MRTACPILYLSCINSVNGNPKCISYFQGNIRRHLGGTTSFNYWEAGLPGTGSLVHFSVGPIRWPMKAWWPTPVFLPEESHGQRSLAGYSTWGSQGVGHNWVTKHSTAHKVTIYKTPLGFPHSSAGKESACNAGDPGSIPASGSSAGHGIGYPLQYSWASLVAQLIKNPPAMQETWVGKIPWRERLPTPAFSSPWGCKESDTTEWLSLSVLAMGLPMWHEW